MTTDSEILKMSERWDKVPVGILADLKDLRVLLKNRNYGDQPAVYHLVDILIKHFEIEICPHCCFGRVTLEGEHPYKLSDNFKDCPHCLGTGLKGDGYARNRRPPR